MKKRISKLVVLLLCLSLCLTACAKPKQPVDPQPQKPQGGEQTQPAPQPQPNPTPDPVPVPEKGDKTEVLNALSGIWMLCSESTGSEEWLVNPKITNDYVEISLIDDSAFVTLFKGPINAEFSSIEVLEQLPLTDRNQEGWSSAFSCVNKDELELVEGAITENGLLYIHFEDENHNSELHFIKPADIDAWMAEYFSATEGVFEDSYWVNEDRGCELWLYANGYIHYHWMEASEDANHNFLGHAFVDAQWSLEDDKLVIEDAWGDSESFSLKGSELIPAEGNRSLTERLSRSIPPVAPDLGEVLPSIAGDYVLVATEIEGDYIEYDPEDEVANVYIFFENDEYIFEYIRDDEMVIGDPLIWQGPLFMGFANEDWVGSVDADLGPDEEYNFSVAPDGKLVLQYYFTSEDYSAVSYSFFQQISY